MNTNQPLLFPTVQPLPGAWTARLQNVLARIRPCLRSMKLGESRKIARVSAKCPSVTLVKLSAEPGRCQAMAVLSTDTVLLVSKAWVQVLHQDRAYEGAIDPAI